MPRANPETLTRLQRALVLRESIGHISAEDLHGPSSTWPNPLILEYCTIIQSLRGKRIISVASGEQLQFLSDMVAGGMELKVSIHSSTTEDKDALIEFAEQLGFKVMH